MSRISAFGRNISSVADHDMFQAVKPWLETGARMTGLKSLYDVPEYFRQKAELQGLSIGSKKIGGGLSGTAKELLKRTNDKTGESGSVRESIDKLNKKLALTKEGSVKNSEARKEMARILWENRRKKDLNEDEIGSQVKDVLDKHTTQKVSGAQAAREALRSAAMATGLGPAAIPLINAGSTAAEKFNNLKQEALRSGESFNAGYLAGKIKEGVGENLGQLKKLGSSDTSIDEKLGVLSNYANAASQSGLMPGEMSTALSQFAARRATPNTSGAKISPSKKTNPPVTNVKKKYKAANSASKLSGLRRGRAGRGGRSAGARKVLRKVSKVAPPQLRAAAKVADIALSQQARIKVGSLSAEITSWAAPLWLFFQLPLAILVLIFIGLSSVFEEFFTVEEDDWGITILAKEIANEVISTASTLVTDAVAFLTGIDVDPTSIALLLNTAVVFIGLGTLIVMTIQYALAGTSILGGKGGGVKFITLAFVTFFYIFPFFNLFPWFFVWIAVVFAYPE